MKFLNEIKLQTNLSYKNRLKIKKCLKNMRSLVYVTLLFFQTKIGKNIKCIFSIIFVAINIRFLSKTWYYSPLNSFIFPILVLDHSKNHQVRDTYDLNYSFNKIKSSLEIKYL